MEVKALIGLLLLVGSVVTVCPQFFSTASSGVSNIPEFVHVVMLDELLILYYDSNSQKLEVKQSWMDQVPREYLEGGTRILQGHQQVYKADIETLKKVFYQTGGQFISHGLKPESTEFTNSPYCCTTKKLAKFWIALQPIRATKKVT
ncbi:HLA class I histocompatibility antigen, A-2 alpha chain [Merluccius polli]|uniref:HLA class I histocompatibility antigen, A-2 alpha chain n=1 Tax=Merluccius polli TaxID=89951 RepID=A0AA47NWV0_MERPO|nr:HLA class I histocompatibility antigen, A-2 alpha chain [Merluccius polli]